MPHNKKDIFKMAKNLTSIESARISTTSTSPGASELKKSRSSIQRYGLCKDLYLWELLMDYTTHILSQNAHIHLMGICGVGMSSLAGMLKEKGDAVTGSDQNT